MRNSVLTLAVLASMSVAAHVSESSDTVKIINRPGQVIITENDGEVRLKVQGEGDNESYRYEYRVKHEANDRMTTAQAEGHDLEFNYPFKKCDSVANLKPHTELFVSDFYLGVGGNHVEPTYRDAVRGVHTDFGVLNLLGLGWVFNRNRSRLSLGLGFNWAAYSVRKPFFWGSTDEGIAHVTNMEENIREHNSTLECWSMQFPLLYNQRLGKRWNLAGGVVANWNISAKINNSYRVGKSDYSITTRGLHQRKFSVDYVGMISFYGLGVFARFSPQSVFKCGFGPNIDNRWSVGLIFH